MITDGAEVITKGADLMTRRPTVGPVTPMKSVYDRPCTFEPSDLDLDLTTMKQKRIPTVLLILVTLVSLWLVSTPTTHSQQPSRNVEARVNALLANMTLAEKLGQLQQLDGEGNGAFRPEHADLLRKGLLGSTLNVRGAINTNQLQHIAVEESRLKIPNLFGYDVIHGFAHYMCGRSWKRSCA